MRHDVGLRYLACTHAYLYISSFVVLTYETWKKCNKSSATAWLSQQKGIVIKIPVNSLMRWFTREELVLFTDLSLSLCLIVPLNFPVMSTQLCWSGIPLNLIFRATESHLHIYLATSFLEPIDERTLLFFSQQSEWGRILRDRFKFSFFKFRSLGSNSCAIFCASDPFQTVRKSCLIRLIFSKFILLRSAPPRPPSCSHWANDICCKRRR